MSLRIEVVDRNAGGGEQGPLREYSELQSQPNNVISFMEVFNK